MSAQVETSTDTDATEKPTATIHLVRITANVIRAGMAMEELANVSDVFENVFYRDCFFNCV